MSTQSTAMGLGGLLSMAFLFAGCEPQPNTPPPATLPAETLSGPPMMMLVMDPLCIQLACECVEGYAQRNYDKLAEFLEKRVGRPIDVAFSEDLAGEWRKYKGKIDLIIGKDSLVVYDAAEIGVPVTRIARLTGLDGATTLTGLFIVRGADPAKTVADLKGYRMLFGPKWAEEKHAAGLRTLRAAGIVPPEPIKTLETCSLTAVDVIDKHADAAVVSSYAMALLEGCDTIAKGELRVVGKTEPLPFVTAFTTPRVDARTRQTLLEGLLAVESDAALKKALETKRGFVPVAWTDWRGPDRSAVSGHVPAKLPAAAKILWKTDLTGPGMAGISATTERVLVADKDKDEKNDIWRCLAADDGREIWQLRYEAAEEMDYTNVARAMPLIVGDRAYLLGALGHLHCVRMSDGHVLWKKHMVTDLGGRLPLWGYAATPLWVDGKLIVNPGGKDASLVALSAATGEVVWRTPGREAAYASFIVATLGGVRQIVGYDAVSLGGWDPLSGKRLWKLIPPLDSDFNVPTPIEIDGKLLVTTENNATRLYGFDDGGKIRPKPVAVNEDLGPDSSTPVLIDNLLFGASNDTLYCLDVADGLKTLWQVEDDAFAAYVSMIAGNGRVLITNVAGDLLLVRADRGKYDLVSRLSPFAGEAEVWSHPALLGDRLYIRSHDRILCLSLKSQ